MPSSLSRTIEDQREKVGTLPKLILPPSLFPPPFHNPNSITVSLLLESWPGLTEWGGDWAHSHGVGVRGSSPSHSIAPSPSPSPFAPFEKDGTRGQQNRCHRKVAASQESSSSVEPPPHTKAEEAWRGTGGHGIKEGGRLENNMGEETREGRKPPKRRVHVKTITPQPVDEKERRETATRRT